MAQTNSKEKPKSLSDIIKSKILSVKGFDRDSYLDLNNPQKVDCISTGSVIIDKVLGISGIPRGRVTELFGAESSGKSTIACTIAREAQRQGLSVAYFDYENAFVHTYAKKLGVDLHPDRLALFNPPTFEEGWFAIRALLTNPSDLGLIICDSVSAMTPKAILEAKVDENAQIGLQARFMSRFLAECVQRLKDANVAMLLVNQVRSRIKTSMYDPGPDTDTSGGRALKFYATIRLELVKRGVETIDGINDLDGTDEKQAISNTVTCINRKNKLALPYRKADFVIRFGEGVDNVRSLIDIAVNLNIIRKTGSWFEFRGFDFEADSKYLNDENKIQGIESVRDYMNAHPSSYRAMAQAIFERDPLAQDRDAQDQGKKDEEDIEEFAKKEIAKSEPKKKGRGSKKAAEQQVDDALKASEVATSAPTTGISAADLNIADDEDQEKSDDIDL